MCGNPFGGGNPLRIFSPTGPISQMGDPILSYGIRKSGKMGKIEEFTDPAGIFAKPPEAPTPEPYPTLAQANSPESIDEAQLQARARERRRAALRFGRASTIGAGSVGAPAGSGNRLLGS